MIGTSITITYLNLYNNHIRDGGAKLLQEYLAIEGRYLTELYLYNSIIQAKAAIAQYCFILK
jgi:hypothetical protein